MRWLRKALSVPIALVVGFLSGFGWALLLAPKPKPAPTPTVEIGSCVVSSPANFTCNGEVACRCARNRGGEIVCRTEGASR